jgi:hypothetical protein
VPREAHWLEDYFAELRAFPAGRHDDRVDSTSQALKWIRELGEVPAITRFYRELVRQENPPPTGTWRMKPPTPVSDYFMEDGSKVQPGPDGVFTFREDFALWLLGLQRGWTRV